MIPAGHLRHWLTFEKMGEVTLDSNGAQIQDWDDAFDSNTRMPAEVVALKGRELVAAQAVHSHVSTRIRVRYRPTFMAGMRATGTDGTIYNIEAVVPDPNSRIGYSTLLCSSGMKLG